jgi:hypothetical protein
MIMSFGVQVVVSGFIFPFWKTLSREFMMNTVRNNNSDGNVLEDIYSEFKALSSKPILYGSIHLKIIFRDGRPDRYEITMEESRKIN